MTCDHGSLSNFFIQNITRVVATGAVSMFAWTSCCRRESLAQRPKRQIPCVLPTVGRRDPPPLVAEPGQPGSRAWKRELPLASWERPSQVL